MVKAPHQAQTPAMYALRANILSLLVVLFVAVHAVRAETPLTVRDAVLSAIQQSPNRRIAAAEHRAAVAAATQARAAFFPQITFSELAIRSNDPVFVFGTKLRQQRFTGADFTLAELNTPSAVANVATRLSGQWTLFDSFTSLRQHAAAKYAAVAAEKSLSRAEQELSFQVVEAYYAVLYAQRRVALAEVSVATAQAMHDRSSARVESGVAVDSDRLSTMVNLGSRQADLDRARNDLTLARFVLSIAMGNSSAAQAEVVETQVEADRQLPALDSLLAEALSGRSDLQAAAAMQQSQQAREAAARGAFGPRLNAFGAFQSESRQLFGSHGTNWTTGLELQLDLFSGGAKRAHLQQERAGSERISAVRQAAEDQVRLEVQRAYFEFESARSQMQIMRSAMQHAEEGLRILRNRYESGLATIADLLRGEEAARQAQTDHWSALYRMHTSMAALRLATGTLAPETLEY